MSSERLPVVAGNGLLLIGDPHLADIPPGQRLPGYREQVLDKLAACLDRAAKKDLVPVILGDLFHWPRDNSNQMLVALMAMFAKPRPFVLVGNHDKYQARFTPDVSLAVLDAAGVVRLMAEPGPRFLLDTPKGRALIGSTPDGYRLPKAFERDSGCPETVVWLCHHNISFPEFLDRACAIKEIPGVDWLINGHIHRPQPSMAKGQTTWANPGNITRLTFTRRSLEREPAAFAWAPGCSELEKWVIPHLPFEQVFPDQEFPPEEMEQEGDSRFIKGLERLAWKRTREGVGLKQFLEKNLDPEKAESSLIWELYKEVTASEGK